MFSLNRIYTWGLFLLVCFSILPMETGSAQQPPKPNTTSKGKSTPIKNPDRQAALAQIRALAAARAQSDPAYKVYLDSLNNHDQQVKAFVKARKGGSK